MQCQRCLIQCCITHINTNHEHLCERCYYNMGDITRNFSLHEFSCKCGCGFNSIDERIVHRLQVVRDILQVKITINSGCRCSKHHIEIYEKLNKLPPMGSLHLEGFGMAKAVDWMVEDEEKFMEAGRLLANWSGGFHQYSNFTHTDIGRRRRW
jgi:hypothetical protein